MVNLPRRASFYDQANPSGTSSSRPEWSDHKQFSESAPFGSSKLYGVSNPLSILGTASGIAGLHALGKTKTPLGNNVYDYVVGGLRTAEEYSPMQMFRTFQLGSFFSQFTSKAQAQQLNWSPKDLMARPDLQEYFSKLIKANPADNMRILQEGLSYKSGQLLWGESGDVALKYAGLILNTPATENILPSANWSAAYARSIGVDDYSSTWKGPRLERIFSKVHDPELPYGVQVIGGSSRVQHVARQAKAWAAEGVGRFNRLMNNPFEFLGFEQAFEKSTKLAQKIPIIGNTFKYGFGVKPGGAVSTLGRLVGKWGVAGLLGYTAWQEVDRLARKSTILEDTALGDGTNVALASLWVKGNLAASKFAQATGLQDLRREQEEVAPGSTSLTKLLTFPVIGALSGATLHYGRRIHSTAVHQFAGAGIMAASGIAKESMTSWGDGVFGAIGKTLSRGPFSKLSPGKALIAAGAAMGVALIAPFLPGALVPEQTPEELEGIYSGRTEVAVRKGRFWELGRSAYEGDRISAFVPHWFPRLKWNAREKMLWGEDAENTSEFAKLFRKEFTYDLEQRHYKSRPYPQTSAAFEEVPLIGPILAATLGRIFKPAVLMHTEEWMRTTEDGRIETKVAPLKYGQSFAGELGEMVEGRPVSSHDLDQVVGEQIYRFTEMAGLLGFTAATIKGKITGSSDTYADSEQLQTARGMFGVGSSFWEEEIGGGLFTSEFFRRLYPHRRNQIPLYNPLRNEMPDWMPGPGDRGPDFQSGDPYRKVSLGEVRLPGAGYAERFEELKGVDPKDYPLIHQFKILGDVAPFSTKYKSALKDVQAMRKFGEWEDSDESIYAETLRQVNEKRKGTEFQEYQYASPYEDDRSSNMEEASVLAAINKANAEASGAKKSSLLGEYWEKISHGAESSLEQLTPVSPAAKLMHVRDPIESYERTQLYGQKASFWETPIESFIAPFISSTSKAFGLNNVPDKVQRIRETEEYFDILKYIKSQSLAQQALAEGNSEDYAKYSRQKEQTLFGMNPYTQNPVAAFAALPSRDRDYFAPFLEAKTTEEKAKILEMVPDNQKALYVAQWQLKYADQVKQATESGVIGGELAATAAAQVAQISSVAKTEGMPYDKELASAYLEEALPDEDYADWYRRTKILPKKLKGKALPGPDWVGYHPAVDLEDIKLKFVDDLGENIHDYNLWQERDRAIRYKPFIGTKTNSALHEETSDVDIEARLGRMFSAGKAKMTTMVAYSPQGENSATISIDQDRNAEFREIIRRSLSE